MSDHFLYFWTARARGYRSAGSVPAHESHVVKFNDGTKLTPGDAALVEIANRDIARLAARFARPGKRLFAMVHSAVAALSMIAPEAARWLKRAEATGHLSDVRDASKLVTAIFYTVIFAGDTALSAAAFAALRITKIETYAAALALATALCALTRYVGMYSFTDNTPTGHDRARTLKRVAIPALAIGALSAALIRFVYMATTRSGINPPSLQNLIALTVAFAGIQGVFLVAGTTLARTRASRDPKRSELEQQRKEILRKLRRAYNKWTKSGGKYEALRAPALEEALAIQYHALAVIFEGRDGRSHRHPDVVWHPALQAGVTQARFAPLPRDLTLSVDPLPADILAVLQALGLVASAPTTPVEPRPRPEQPEAASHTDSHDHGDDENVSAAA